MVVKSQNPYKTEADLCDAFVAVAAQAGWQAYPECGNWDLLMVRDGIQVGIEAKLRCNIDVLAQAVQYSGAPYVNVPQPHYRGVLVPSATFAMKTVCASLRLHRWDHQWITDRYDRGDLGLHEGYLFGSENRVELPEVAIQTSGGCPSPKLMSKWRINALRICILFEEQGYLTRADILDGGCDPGRWTQFWMVPDGQVMGTKGRMVTRYVPNPRRLDDMPSFGYEAEMAALAAKDIKEASA